MHTRTARRDRTIKRRTALQNIGFTPRCASATGELKSYFYFSFRPSSQGKFFYGEQKRYSFSNNIQTRALAVIKISENGMPLGAVPISSKTLIWRVNELWLEMLLRITFLNHTKLEAYFKV
jgi:hypothetical protein